MIEASAIRPEEGEERFGASGSERQRRGPCPGAARGYRSVTAAAELAALGFGEKQRRVPGLLVPLHGVYGEVWGYQLRPNRPRKGRDGNPIKYETPREQSLRLDVPPGARAALDDPQVPLFVTEGARKADAAVSQGLCCLALLGVWGWRGTHAKGGRAVLPDWDAIALNGRRVYLVFDSDVATKGSVRAALLRLAGSLQQRGAPVRCVFLPPGPDDAKVGLDDFLAAGGTPAQLLALAPERCGVRELAPAFTGGSLLPPQDDAQTDEEIEGRQQAAARESGSKLPHSTPGTERSDLPDGYGRGADCVYRSGPRGLEKLEVKPADIIRPEVTLVTPLANFGARLYLAFARAIGAIPAETCAALSMGAARFRDYARAQYGLSLPLEEATRLRDAFFRAYPDLARWHRRTGAGRDRETRTLTGPRPFTQRLNTPVQGTGADGLKRALALLWERRAQCPDAVPIIACHDEIVVECDAAQADACAAWLKQAMMDAIAPLIAPVPVDVEVSVGQTWAGLGMSAPLASCRDACYTRIMNPTQATDFLDRLLDPVSRCLPPEAARALVALRADTVVQKRIDWLAERCNEGELTPEERAEYEAYVHAIDLIALLQAKARARLDAIDPG